MFASLGRNHRPSHGPLKIHDGVIPAGVTATKLSKRSTGGVNLRYYHPMSPRGNLPSYHHLSDSSGRAVARLPQEVVDRRQVTEEKGAISGTASTRSTVDSESAHEFKAATSRCKSVPNLRQKTPLSAMQADKIVDEPQLAPGRSNPRVLANERAETKPPAGVSTASLTVRTARGARQMQPPRSKQTTPIDAIVFNKADKAQPQVPPGFDLSLSGAAGVPTLAHEPKDYSTPIYSIWVKR